ncbi:hypothetical protein M405DRAFT_459344 [Rhizopogon salebrosus TDB-379]|nr:hypothetical protein M405DRAFT_459344 [Rhizopogon salebrosus TDB-379]
MSPCGLLRQHFRGTRGGERSFDMIEVFFAVRHYYLRDKKFDMFQTDIQQIKIVKLGGSITSSGFKRRNARKGLLNVIDSTSTGKDNEEGRTEKRVRSDRGK